MIKKIIMILALLSLLSGCKDYKETENLTIATAIAVDKLENDFINVLIEVVKFNKDDSQTFYVEASGATFSEAINNAVAMTQNELYFSHAQAIIISEEVAKNDVYSLIDNFCRNKNMRLDMAMLVAKGSSAKEILMVKSEIDDVAGLQIKEIIDSNKAISEVPSMPIYEFIDDLSAKGISASLPSISLTTNYKGEPARNIDGYAIFSDGKLYSFLDKKQTKSLSVLVNKAENGKVINEYIEQTPTYNLEKSNTKVSVRENNGNLEISYKISLKLKIDELKTPENVINSKNREQMEQEISLAVKKDIEDLILFQKQNSKSDFLGIGQQTYMKNLTIWQENSNDFAQIIENMNYFVNVDCEIISTGTMQNLVEVNN